MTSPNEQETYKSGDDNLPLMYCLTGADLIFKCQDKNISNIFGGFFRCLKSDIMRANDDFTRPRDPRWMTQTHIFAGQIFF